MAHKRHKWTLQEDIYLCRICQGYSYKELVLLMSNRFHCGFTLNMIRGRMNTYGFVNGIDCKYKVNNTSPRYSPIGSERINIEGYYEVKISDSEWVRKHRLIYEWYYGPISEGYNIIFLDGDKTNLSIDNLYCIDNVTMGYMNKRNMFSTNPYITKTAIKVAQILSKIKSLK